MVGDVIGLKLVSKCWRCNRVEVGKQVLESGEGWLYDWIDDKCNKLMIGNYKLESNILFVTYKLAII